MPYALIDDNNNVTKYPANLRDDFPNTSFPTHITQDCLPYGCVLVQATPCEPSDNQYATDTAQLVDGVWTQVWTYFDKTEG